MGVACARMTQRPVVNLDVLVMGFQMARKRLQDAMGRNLSMRQQFGPHAISQPLLHAYVPLFETLNWGATVMDRLGKQQFSLPPDIDDLAEGFRYVRNRVHHDWADALEARDDVMLPSGPTAFTLPLVTDWCWRQVADLPEPEKFNRGCDEYARALAARSSRATIDALGEFLYTTVLPTQSPVA
jgi:hypothetical protein